eukprot:CAMPEP_0172533340 /NCGR_PEP_ID=MMETSP1067-20121228/6080_1 /TAXON_ID=265564 ORGANISM="Thalassiosira punctigera, Strain Tpunct2005C2" /NCGR_SAMPLE_ID=MMETSP1067 /ASSEMBLY_ACC=CAM_ASM_000444 /LENGTH=346 /DNA_ID=CAMNT_0013317969 /DNA_START=43 /DNA_END=1080 /DNA_ORIENTATION=+
MVGTLGASLWGLFSLPFITITRQTDALNINARSDNAVISRRRFALHLPAATSAAAIFGGAAPTPAADLTTASPIAGRFDSDILTSPPVTAGTRYTGHENLFFPSWMEGEWDATQTLVSTKTPLGLKFVGGPQGSLDVARKTMEEQNKRLGEPVGLKLRFVNTSFGVAEDRAFNLRSRLDSFAGRSVVASVEYADVRESNRASILAGGGTESDPLTTTLVYFKGPAAQKTFVISHGQDPLDSDAWSGYELDRSIFALTNQSTAPPVTTDTEALYWFKRIGNDRVEGRLRLAGYLNPQADQLYFDAKNRAVSLNDYTLSLDVLQMQNNNRSNEEKAPIYSDKPDPYFG